MQSGSQHVPTTFVVLLSSGLDSTVNMYKAAQMGRVVQALTFDYGQRAAQQEIKHAQKTAQHLGVPHQVIDLPWFGKITSTSLVNVEREIPIDVNLSSTSATQGSASQVWVPNRNGVFLNIAAAFAESLGADAVVPGFNLEEAATFSDNTKEFCEAATQSFFYSTTNHIQTVCFTLNMRKSEIVALGRQLEVVFEHVWSCYFGGTERCHRCESCLRFDRALHP